MVAVVFGTVTGPGGDAVPDTRVEWYEFSAPVARGETTTDRKGEYWMRLIAGFGFEAEFRLIVIAIPPDGSGLDRADTVIWDPVYFSATPGEADTLQVDFELTPTTEGKG